MTIKNNALGRVMWKMLLKCLNRKLYRVRRRGRHPHRKVVMRRHGLVPNYNGDIPVRLADRWAIYLDKKPPVNWQRRYIDAV